ncbi:uncharacterized protein N7446_010742 [Penicillium canescens]|uniref:Uncharacterized protein n=1 Tax=Penicillium canescens TaxID=5083 RepID=A0AAD6N8D5_PENCN|nr:uncharacterized protein N7446_010742 [Penicillium canescens]KAJ6041370.1 hypothetical protein N7460_006760 [Penicillium canescens]KAJ6050633.1 hypothetical protein N7446_010742 [Penicillium canescens]KAJ6065856.1 hypothetical protein N7444_001509 [Penicillium canescens]
MGFESNNIAHVSDDLVSALLHSGPEITSDDTLVRRPDQDEVRQLRTMAVPGVARQIGEVLQDTNKILSYRLATAHPKFFSCIPSPVSRLSWLGDCVATAHNPFGGSWEAGPGVCTIESSLIGWIAEQFGLPSSAGGQFVSGASMANLTAVIVARDQKLKIEQRVNGVAYISEEAHFCIGKVLRIVGISDIQIRVIKTDDKFQLDTVKLQHQINEDITQGRQPFLIVASCGTTNTRSIDPLRELRQIADTYDMWLHVDAAYGGSVAFSKTHRSKIQDIGLAQSIAWDAHKWLFQTHGCGAVFFREQAHPLESFSGSGGYVQDVECAQKPSDPWNYGIELTRPARHMRLWFTLQVLGLEKIDQMISWGFDLSHHLESKLRRIPDWEIISPSSLAILTFRYAPAAMQPDNNQYNNYNTLISKKIASENKAVIFTTRLQNQVCLRMCTINPKTTEDIEEVVQALDRIAREILGESQAARFRSRL